MKKKEPEIIKTSKVTQQLQNLREFDDYKIIEFEDFFKEINKKSGKEQIEYLSKALALKTGNKEFEKLIQYQESASLAEEVIALNTLKCFLFKLEKHPSSLSTKFIETIKTCEIPSLSTLDDLREIHTSRFIIKEMLSDKVFPDQGITRLSLHEVVVSISASDLTSKTKTIQQLRDEGLIEYTPIKSGTQEIIQAPGAWVICNSENKRNPTYRKLFDTQDLEGLTIKTNDGKVYKIEDFLHTYLTKSQSTEAFEFVANANVKAIMLMSDQAERLSFLTPEEKDELSKEDLKEWLDLVSSNARTINDQLSQGNSESKLKKLKLWHKRDNQAFDRLQDEKGNTPLHFAAKNGNIELVRELLGAGFKANIKNEEGKTFLEVSNIESRKELEAIFTAHAQTFKYNIRNIESVKAFIQNAPDINIRDKKNNTLLHNLVSKPSHSSEDLSLIANAMSRGADIYALDSKGEPPLKIAIDNGNIDVIRALIQNTEFKKYSQKQDIIDYVKEKKPELEKEVRESLGPLSEEELARQNNKQLNNAQTTRQTGSAPTVTKPGNTTTRQPRTAKPVTPITEQTKQEVKSNASDNSKIIKQKFLEKVKEEYGENSKIYIKAEKYITGSSQKRDDIDTAIENDHAGFGHKFAELFKGIRRTDKEILKQIQSEFSSLITDKQKTKVTLHNRITNKIIKINRTKS